jgi:hypothetical protein
MHYYYANASVIYTDGQGNRIDTFVIFDTDKETGLTHINHENLKVGAGSLVLHEKTVCRWHLPIEDAFSFEILKKLRDKYELIDSIPKLQPKPVQDSVMHLLAKAS